MSDTQDIHTRNAFDAAFSPLFTLLHTTDRKDPLQVTTVLDHIDQLICTFVTDPMIKPRCSIAYAQQTLQKSSSGWLVSALGRFEDEHLMERISETLSKLAGRAATKALERVWHFENAGDIVIHEPSFTEADIGFQTWDAGVLLARLIDQNRIPIFYHSVLELGSGTGLAGFVCARIGSRQQSAGDSSKIVLTDYHPGVLSTLVHNAQSNGLAEAVQIRKLDWTDLIIGNPIIRTEEGLEERNSADAVPMRFLTILASDCAYEPSHPELIPEVVQAYLAAGPAARFHCLLPMRRRFEGEFRAFVYNMEQKGFTLECDESIIEEDISGGNIEFRLLSFKMTIA